jgi:hypothetical protein
MSPHKDELGLYSPIRIVEPNLLHRFNKPTDYYKITKKPFSCILRLEASSWNQLFNTKLKTKLTITCAKETYTKFSLSSPAKFVPTKLHKSPSKTNTKKLTNFSDLEREREPERLREIGRMVGIGAASWWTVVVRAIMWWWVGGVEGKKLREREK